MSSSLAQVDASNFEAEVIGADRPVLVCFEAQY